MRKQPRKIKHWADEAYAALDVAWGLLREEYPNADENQKLELVRYAPAIAGMYRGIHNKNKIQEAFAFVYERTAEDIRNKEEGDPILYSILFLLGYLDSHIIFGVLSEKKVDEIMEYLSENYDMSYEPWQGTRLDANYAALRFRHTAWPLGVTYKLRS